MKSKDKMKKHMKISIKNIMFVSVFVIILLFLLAIYDYYFRKDEVYAQEASAKTNQNNVKISNASEIDLEKIMNQNSENKAKEEYMTEEVELEYITKYRQNENIPTGTIQVVQEGREGKQEITTKKTYKNGQVASEEQVNSKITKASVDKIVEIGTGTKKSKHIVQIGESVQITSDRASIMLEADENSQKVATLTKGMELKVLEIKNEWYKISGKGTVGYIKSENTSYSDNEEKEDTKQKNKTNENSNNATNIAKLSFDMELNKPSGLSLEQFEKVLTDSKDKKNVFKNNAKYFYYVEQQYNINGLFVAALGIHESNWGTSKIAQNKHNLFGYGAYDSNPYNGAYDFKDYSESIDLVSRVFIKYYLNPKGTAIYGGEIASGKYYSGATLSGINKKYATDKNWANGVYKNMEYLYNKL